MKDEMVISYIAQNIVYENKTIIEPGDEGHTSAQFFERQKFNSI